MFIAVQGECHVHSTAPKYSSALCSFKTRIIGFFSNKWSMICHRPAGSSTALDLSIGSVFDSALKPQDLL